MGRKEKQSLGRGGGESQFLKFTDWIGKPKERKHPRSNLGNKSSSSAKEPGLSEAKGQAHPAASEEGTAARARAQPMRRPREARPTPPNPGFADCHSGWTLPKDSTANIFFINIFLFFISGLTPNKRVWKDSTSRRTSLDFCPQSVANFDWMGAADVIM